MMTTTSNRHSIVRVTWIPNTLRVMVGEVKVLIMVAQGLMMEGSMPSVEAQWSPGGAEVKGLVE